MSNKRKLTGYGARARTAEPGYVVAGTPCDVRPAATG
jgi:hypothetical protein